MGGGGWLDKSIIMLISAPVEFELGLGAELGNKHGQKLITKTFSAAPKTCIINASTGYVSAG